MTLELYTHFRLNPVSSPSSTTCNTTRRHDVGKTHLNPDVDVGDVGRRALHLLLQVLQLPLHPLLAERHRVHLLLQLVAQNRRGFLARLLVLKKPKLTFKMEPESCPNLETCALAESFVHLAYPRLKAMKEEVGVWSFQKTFPI